MANKKPIAILIFALFLIASFQIQPTSSDHSTEEEHPIYKDIEFLVVEIPDSEGEGFEPHVIAGAGIDGKEWYYIDSPTGLSSRTTGNLWISKDYGLTWEFKVKPPNNYGGSGDSFTAITKEGYIFYTDLYVSDCTIDVSQDGGDTWLQNPFASTKSINDRQWLMAGPTVGLGTRDETIYFVYNQAGSGLTIDKSVYGPLGYGWDWIPGNRGLPVSTIVEARDYIAVDQNDGTVYLPNYEGSSTLAVYVSSDGANSFTRYQVQNATPEMQNIFIVIDVDSAGNVYLTWSSQEHIYMSVSQDKGKNWKTIQVTTTPGIRVMPWITAGDKGRIAITYYETNMSETTSDKAEGANWSVNTAISINALNETPTFYFTKVVPYVHTGTIRTTGISGEADRDLGDFLTNDVDSKGRIIMVFGKDGDDGVGARMSKVVFARQNEGPFLKENVGPEANFTYKINGLRVEVNAKASKDLGNALIKEYIWDWGDGTNSPGVEDVHTYAKDGEYNITLKVVNADNMIAKKTVNIKLKKEKEAQNYLWIYVLAVLLIIGSTFAYYLWRRNKMKL